MFPLLAVVHRATMLLSVRQKSTSGAPISACTNNVPQGAANGIAPPRAVNKLAGDVVAHLRSMPAIDPIFFGNDEVAQSDQSIDSVGKEQNGHHYTHHSCE
jgi:hypothetical protein